MTSFYNEKEFRDITKYLKKIQFGNSLNFFLWEWLKTSTMQSILIERPSIINPKTKENVKITLIKRFIRIIGKFIFNQEDFTWEVYCKIMNEIRLEQRSCFHLPLREMTRSFYLHALTSESINNPHVKSFIESKNNLLLSKEFKRHEGNLDSIYINECIRTNFPLESSPEQIIQVEFTYNNGSVGFANFYLPSRSQFLRGIIKAFLETISKRKVNNIFNRIIVTLFEKSLGNKEVNRFEDFNEQTFKQQIFYFKSLVESNFVTSIRYLHAFLVKFYRFIDDNYFEEYGVRLFNSFSFNRDLIIHKHYLVSIEQGYEIVNLNSMGTFPGTDKWFVVADAERRGTKVQHLKNSLMDFELISNTEFRKVLKDYIWNSNLSYGSTYNHFNVITNLLNSAQTYYEQESRVLQMSNLSPNHLKPFSNRFLFFYIASLKTNQDYAATTLKNNIIIIRRFLMNIQHQYNIPDIVIEQFTTNLLDNKGGNPIIYEDFKEIRYEFERQYKSNEIMLIILQLAVETKIRLSEIFGLKRDCIISLDESEKYGTIKYYSKTSGGKKKKEVLLIEHIRLIQKAIKITQPICEKAENSLNQYIFIHNHYHYQNQIISARNPFIKAFRSISNKLFEQGRIKFRYTPYNLRDTYIDMAWQLVEDGLVSTIEVGVITGNSVTVAAKHYRNRENTKRYVEALYEVSILDDDLTGSIINDDALEKFPPVQGGAGNCVSDSCIKIDIDEDSFYKCLTCKKFVTSVEKYPFFEYQMKMYKEKKEKSTSTIERNFYNGLIELYGSYLASMYDKLEGEE